MLIGTPEAWFSAIKGRRCDVVSKYVRRFAGTRTANGDTGLILAVRQKDYEMVKILAPVEAQLSNKDGLTALLVAAEMGHLACCLPLLQHERNIADAEGHTPLMLAARAGHVGCIPFLITNTYLSRDYRGYNALEHAVLGKQLEAVRCLLQPDLYPASDVKRAIDLADSLKYILISKALCKCIAGYPAADNTLPPSSVIISVVPDGSRINRDASLTIDASLNVLEPSFMENDGSLCLGDLSMISIPVPVPSLEQVNLNIADLRQQLASVAEFNVAQQTDYRAMTALCSEAQLKIAMQKDIIDSSMALTEKLEQCSNDLTKAADRDAIILLLGQQLSEIKDMQREIKLISGEVGALKILAK